MGTIESFEVWHSLYVCVKGFVCWELLIFLCFFFSSKEDQELWETKKVTQMLEWMVVATRCKRGIVRIQIKSAVYCPVKSHDLSLVGSYTNIVPIIPFKIFQNSKGDSWSLNEPGVLRCRHATTGVLTGSGMVVGTKLYSGDCEYGRYK